MYRVYCFGRWGSRSSLVACSTYDEVHIRELCYNPFYFFLLVFCVFFVFLLAGCLVVCLFGVGVCVSVCVHGWMCTCLLFLFDFFIVFLVCMAWLWFGLVFCLAALTRERLLIDAPHSPFDCCTGWLGCSLVFRIILLVFDGLCTY